MARKTKEKILADVHSRAIKEFDQIHQTLQTERLQCLQDRRFYSIPGAQWEGKLSEQFENKPQFEVNKVHLAVIRIINEYRNNRITVDFVSKEGLEDDKLADLCDGLYRADENSSVAEEAYDNAFEEAVAGGVGAWRLRAEYEDEEDPENDRQRIRIEPIFDADSSVFFDLAAKRQDKADAKYCFVITSMPRADYEEEWGDSPSSWPKSIDQTLFDWHTPDVVYVAEYYRVEEVKQRIHVWQRLDGEEVRLTDEELEEQLEELVATGATELRIKRTTRKRVRKYILSGGRVLEDCGYIAGDCIPIVPVYGKRWVVDNIERCMGHVRLVKDAQRLKNMQLSKLGELSALSQVEKPIFTPDQIAGHQQLWADDNVKNYPYLLINKTTDLNGNEVAAGPVGYTKPPQIPPAMAALLQVTESDMQDLLGNQQAGEQLVNNVAQGTVELIQQRLDMQTYIYMSNMAKAMRRSGEIWLSMARDVYVEEGRKVKLLGLNGEQDQAVLRRPIIGDDGEVEFENDLSEAKFDVVVEVGPASSTKRAATVRALTNMAAVTDDPETKQVISAMILMNMEGEGISDVRDYFRRKLIKMGVVKPTDQEAMQLMQELANAPPSPQDEYLRAAAAAEQARGAKAQADTILAQAKADKTRAETAETLADIDAKAQDQALEVIEKFGPRVVPPDVPGSPIIE